MTTPTVDDGTVCSYFFKSPDYMNSCANFLGSLNSDIKTVLYSNFDFVNKKVKPQLVDGLMAVTDTVSELSELRKDIKEIPTTLYEITKAPQEIRKFATINLALSATLIVITLIILLVMLFK